MCGFSVAISMNSRKHIPFSNLKKMNEMIAHRGPDKESYFKNTNFFKDNKIKFSMGFRRLKIIDLSSRANQPFFFLKRYVIVFNGEIYNYLEIKKDLIKKGIKFTSKSDTEVILAAFHFYGTKCFTKFNGMWSIVIYDNLKKEFTASRDRYGVKPLYYYLSQNKLYLASEIKQLLFLLKKRKVNLKKIISYFDDKNFSESDETFFHGIKKLEPGMLMIIRKGKIIKKKWYNFKKKNLTKNIKKKLYNDLLKSVELRLRSDAKLGISFSGGIDSTSIASLVAKKEKKNIKKIQTFSSLSGDKNDESIYINSFIKKYLFKNVTTKLSFKKFILELDDMVWAHDEPIGNITVFSEWQLFDLMKKHKVKVNLDGHGADEIFCGYEKYFSLYLKECFKKLNLYRVVIFINDLFSKKINNKFSFISRIVINLLPASILKKIKVILNNNFNVNWLLLNKDLYKNFISKKNFSKDSILDENYNQFFYSSLPEQLQWSDRNSMSHSIESRSPFLDVNIVENFLLLDSKYKIKSITSKYILREALKAILPIKIYKRNFKVGFSAPGEKWIKLNRRVVTNYFIESFQYLEKILSDDCKKKGISIIQGKEKYNDWIWKVIFLGRWFKKFKVSI